MRHGRPIQNARHLPHGIADAIARDLHDGGDKFMVPDAPVVRAGHGAKLNAPILGFQCLHQFAAMTDKAMLQIDARQRCGKITQVAGRCADKAAKLAETPMRRGDGLLLSGHDQRKPLGIVAAGFHTHGATLHGAGLGAIRAGLHGFIKLGQRQIAFVIRAREPFRRNAADIFAARNVHAEALGNGLLVMVQGHGVHGLSFHGLGVERSAALQPCPSARPGGARCKGGRAVGHHPACTSGST